MISATATNVPPLARGATIFLGGIALPVCVPGYVPSDPRDAMTSVASVAPRFFETMRSKIVSGKEFDWSDRIRAGGPFVAVVNEAFARRFFAGQNPLDRRFGVNCASTPFRPR